MKKIKKFDFLIINTFSFLILIIISISLFGYSGFEKIHLLFQQTYQGTFMEWVETEQANTDIIAIHRAMKDVALSRTNEQLEAALDDVHSYDIKIMEYFAAMTRTEDGNSLLSDVITAYDNWAPIREKTIALAKSGQYDLAAENTRMSGQEQAKRIVGKMQLLIDYQKATAEDAYKQSENTLAVSKLFLFLMAVLATALAVSLSFYIRNKLLKFQTLLHEEKEKLQITFDSIGDGIITTDIYRNVVSINKVAEAFTGWTTADASGRSFTEVFDISNEYSGETAKDPVDEVLTTDAICLLENHTILTSKDGTKRHIADSAAPVKDQNGLTSGVVMIFRDVTERKIAEKRIRESEERFRTIFEQAPVGIGLAFSSTGQIYEVNERFSQIIGRSAEEIKNMDWQSITHPDDVQRDLYYKSMLHTRELASCRYNKRFIKPDGSVIWVVLSIVPLNNPDSSGLYNLCMIEDITQKKIAEDDLNISENRLKTAQAIANVGNWEIDLAKNTMWASDQAFKIYGLETNSPFIPIKLAQEVVRKEDRPMMDKALRSLLQENKPYDVQFAIHRADDNSLRIIHSNAVAERDSNGNPIKVIGTIQDITVLKNAELALAQTHINLEATLQSTADGILAVDIDGNIIFYNEQYKNIWGLSDEFMTEQCNHGATFKYMGSLVETEKTYEDMYAHHKAVGSETFDEVYLKNGSTLLRYSIPIWVAEKITGYVFSFRDVTRRKQSEQAFIDSDAKHQAMIANISDSIVIIDKNGMLSYISPNMENLFGWLREDLENKNFAEFIFPDDLVLLRDEFRKMIQEDVSKSAYEFRLKCKDESYKYIRLTAANMLQDPNIQGILVNFHDISERKQRENEILYLNYHDLLTGLYNRAYFEEECNRLDRECQWPISVIMGDINGLKLINDAFGHTEGDKLLVEIAKILSVSCRKEDVLARTGGDEFCILLPQTTAEEARAICKRIYNDCIDYDSKKDRDMIYLSIALGHATKTDSETTIERILTEAEEYMYKQKLLERKSMRSSLISSIKTTMLEKSHLTAEHEERLVALSKKIGQAIDLPDAQINELELLSTLHDIGKLSIDDQILNKPDKLTEEEWAVIKRHPDVGYRIAQASPELVPISEYILCHHERWDGKGYPQGLKADDIPLLSRIVSIVDSYDAMTQDRPYRKAMSEANAMKEIMMNAGTQFDPEIVKIFVGLFAGYTE